MKAKTRTTLVVTAPLVAVATMMVGLRVGAGSAFHAALVYGAAPGQAGPSGLRPHAVQLVTYLEDRGVRETVPLKELSVVAHTDDGQDARWEGASTTDGIAEVLLAFRGEPARVALQLNVAGEREPLAVGILEMPLAPRVQESERIAARDLAIVRPSKREGGILATVHIDGERLVVGAPCSLWVELTLPHGMDPTKVPPVTVRATPEIGVRFEQDSVEKADDGQWVELRAIALGQAASTEITITGPNGLRGTWFGTLPTAPGAFAFEVPPQVFATEPEVVVTIVAPNPRNDVYVEIDDEHGRVNGAALPLLTPPGESLPVARFPIPKDLAPGTHWLVASGNPRGAEKLSGVTMTRSFEVMMPDAKRLPDPTRRANLHSARQIPLGFPRWLAIDGIATRGAQNRARHRLGLFIGLIALAAAALLEVVLLTAAAREARLVLAQAENESPERVTAKPPGGGLLVALLVALLGFAFLAALIIAKA